MTKGRKSVSITSQKRSISREEVEVDVVVVEEAVEAEEVTIDSKSMMKSKATKRTLMEADRKRKMYRRHHLDNAKVHKRSYLSYCSF